MQEQSHYANPVHLGWDAALSAFEPILSHLRHGKAPLLAHISGNVHQLAQVVQHGPPLTLKDLPAFFHAITNFREGLDDREFLLEKILVLLSRLPDNSAFGQQAHDAVIDLLYKDLPHPPTAYLSTLKSNINLDNNAQNSVPYAYRSADGSYTSVIFPNIGQAGNPYVRSVPSACTRSPSCLPDPGLVFDSLLGRRNDDFVPHPGGLSSLFFAFADLIIHSIFNTNTAHWTFNDTSSYVDLSVLYGSNEEQVNKVRRFDGSGKIWNDTFTDSRLLFMPPSVCALVVLFNRHHNYIAQKILELNEFGSYSWPPPNDDSARRAQCDEIFHRSRLVNTAFLMQIILTDYVGCILGFVRDGVTWRIDPLKPFRNVDHSISQRGLGNAVSIEFNLLYRWHATVSLQDEQWLNERFRQLFEGKDPTTIPIDEFRSVIREKSTPPHDVRTWTFGGLRRDADGKFSDNDLARILQDSTEHRAGAFRARGCPTIMRAIEILAIEQGRKWGTCTLNEFRTFIGLKPYTSFKAWNPDPQVYDVAEKLYGDINNLELHVGLQAEETKPPMPGAGLCPGYTISRAILADAVCLTRGDRFLTVDFNAYNLTSWGFRHCMVDKTDGSYGGMLPRLLFQLLPGHYPIGSVYVHFPFMVPEFMYSCIKSMDKDALRFYHWNRPKQFVSGIDEGLSNVSYAERFRERLSNLTRGIPIDVDEVRGCVIHETFSVIPFATITRNLVNQRSFSADDDDVRYLDIVKDVINPVAVYWIYNLTLGSPITAAGSVWGAHSMQQWSDLLTDITRYLYLKNDSVHDWTLRCKAFKATDEIMQCFMARLEKENRGILSLTGASDALLNKIFGRNTPNGNFISKLAPLTTKHDPTTIFNAVFTETVPSAPMFCAILTSVVDYYIKNQQEKQKLVELCLEASDRNGDLLKYIDVALKYQLNSGQDGDNPFRTLALGVGNIGIFENRGLLCRELFSVVAPAMIKSIFSLKNVRTSPNEVQIVGGLPASLIIKYNV